MILFPAIDLKDGQVVRLFKGDFNQTTVFNDNPAEQARSFADAGCSWLHLVDLDGAVQGKPVNAAAVEAILNATSAKVQLGGGIRTLETIEFWLKKGIHRVILGTVALKNPDLVKEAAKRYPGQIVVGIDARNGFVATEGWLEQGTVSVLDLSKEFEDAGVAALIYTDIDRDGALTGVNVEATAALAKEISIPVIASGGVSSLSDLERLKPHAGIAGVISGRALYDGRLDIHTALKILA